MGDNIIDETEYRGTKVKLAHNKKMLEIAKQNGDEDKIKLYEKNITQYEIKLNILKKKKGE